MKYSLITLLFLLGSLKLWAQPQQPKSFYVNACTFYGGFKTELESICDGFEIQITQNTINIGEDINLKIDTRELEGDKTKFLVTDPKGRIIGAFYGKTASGNDYLQLVFKSYKNEKVESGLIFQYWDYVSSYDFWRVDRKRTKTFDK